jgi:hypothetical protein
VLLPLLGLIACGSNPPNAPLGARDSAGVLIRQLAADHRDSLPIWSTRVLFSTSSLDTIQIGDGELSARIVGDSLVVVAQGQQVYVIGMDGNLRRSFGRSGEGPGEYSTIYGLGVNADHTLFLTDFLTGRITHLMLTGEVVSIRPRLAPYSEGIDAEPLVLLADKQMMAIPRQWRPARSALPGIAPGEISRDPVTLLAYSADGTLTDSIGKWPGLERVNGLVIPFARSVVYHSKGTTTVLSVTDSLAVSRYDGRNLKLQFFAPLNSAAPTNIQRRQWDSGVVADLPELGAALVEREKDISGPPTLPTIGGLLVDDSMNIWVGSYATAGQAMREWVVYSSTGEPIGKLELPAHSGVLLPSRAELLDVSARHALVLRRDADGALEIEVRVVERDSMVSGPSPGQIITSSVADSA